MHVPPNRARARATVRLKVLDFGRQHRARPPGGLETLLLAIHAREDTILRHPEAQQQMPAPWVTRRLASRRVSSRRMPAQVRYAQVQVVVIGKILRRARYRRPDQIRDRK